ncbi:MAG: HAMP domain-containing sensor histidine kinase, partial [Methanomicrobium sp.]|nr:HAMP domain-containing sensor histidine kinase [Methanomicrobium sp.]
ISTTAAIFSGEKLILCICRDITSWKNSERALISVNKKLNLLSYITCHDISNKTNGLEIFISLLDENQLNSDMRPYLDEAKKAVHSIMHQIEFTREYEKVGVKEPLWISLEKITEGLFDANVCLNFNCKGVYIYADAMLEKVFYNLFDNTLRHAKRAAVVDINCRKTDESNLVIIWEDNGPGIEDSKKEEIFKRGYGKNTGFGLFLAREILDITKITICETGVFGEGARFEMSVPMGGYKIKDSDER